MKKDDLQDRISKYEEKLKRFRDVESVIDMAVEKAVLEKQQEIAVKLLKRGINIAQTAEDTGLPPAKVKDLAKGIL